MLAADTLGASQAMIDQAVDYAKERSLPLTRGIAIEAADKVAQDSGASATNHVTFNVLR